MVSFCWPDFCCTMVTCSSFQITEIKPLELRVNFGPGLRGRIHITEVNDVNTCEEPFSNCRIGQSLPARVAAKPSQSNIKRGHLWELSIKPAVLRDSNELNGMQTSDQLEFSTGQCVSGYVYKVDSEWVWLTISRNVKAQLFILDSACEPDELQDFRKRFHIGRTFSGYVLTSNKEKRSLRLVQRPILDICKTNIDDESGKTDTSDSNIRGEDAALYIHQGDILGGRISKILPGVGGILVQIGPHIYGKVHFTELKDSWVSNPLSGYHEGQFVKCKILEISRSVRGTLHVDLSLRTSLDGMSSHHSSEACDNIDNACKRIERIEDLSPGMTIQSSGRS